MEHRRVPGGRPHRRTLWLLGGAAAMTAILVAVLLVVVMDGIGGQPAQPAATPPTAPTRSSGTAWPSGANANPPQDIRAWEARLGRPTDVAVVFTARSTWQTITRDDWPMSVFRPDAYPGMLSVAQPLFPQDGNEASCAQGDYDQQWAAFGQTLVRNARPDAIVRPGWEFNGTWFWWTPHDTAVWKQCFRSVVTAIRSTAPDVRIDWNMTGHQNRMRNGDGVWKAYPGDDVVDVVSIDAYDSYPASTSQAAFDGNCNSDSGACTVARFARDHGKQFAVPEWGMDHRKGGGGDNPYYIEKMYDLFVANKGILAYEAYYSAGAQETENVQSALTADLNPNAAQRYLELFGKPAIQPSPAISE